MTPKYICTLKRKGLFRVFFYTRTSRAHSHINTKKGERQLSDSLPYKHEKRERHLSGHSLFNIMYEKKISYSQGEVYEL